MARLATSVSRRWLLLLAVSLQLAGLVCGELAGAGLGEHAHQLMASSFLAMPIPPPAATKQALQSLLQADAGEKLMRFERGCELVCSVYPDSVKCTRCRNRAPLRYGKRAALQDAPVRSAELARDDAPDQTLLQLAEPDWAFS